MEIVLNIINTMGVEIMSKSKENEVKDLREENLELKEENAKLKEENLVIKHAVYVCNKIVMTSKK